MYNKTLSEILMTISTEAYLYVLTNPTQSFKYSTLNEVSMQMLSNINYKTTIIILGSISQDNFYQYPLLNIYIFVLKVNCLSFNSSNIRINCNMNENPKLILEFVY